MTITGPAILLKARSASARETSPFPFGSKVGQSSFRRYSSYSVSVYGILSLIPSQSTSLSSMCLIILFSKLLLILAVTSFYNLSDYHNFHL
jgi:hypothetical protein